MESKYIFVLVLFQVWCVYHRGVAAQGAGYIERQLLCALDQAPCDAWGRQVKAALPEIIGKNCVNCNRAQLNNVNRVARFVETRYPNLWAAIVEKYSPRQQQQQQLQAFASQDTPDQFYNVAPAN